MPVLHSQIDPRSPEFADNAAHLQALVADLRAQLDRVALGGGDKAREKHVARGKLLPRERVDALLDPGSPFLEIAPQAAHGMYEDQAPGAGLVAGIGRVHGGEVMGIWSTPAARFCRCRTRSSPTRSTSAGSSTTRRGSLPRTSRRSRW